RGDVIAREEHQSVVSKGDSPYLTGNVSFDLEFLADHEGSAGAVVVVHRFQGPLRAQTADAVGLRRLATRPAAGLGATRHGQCERARSERDYRDVFASQDNPPKFRCGDPYHP